MNSVDLAVLALYPPVIIFSGWAVYLYIVKVIAPAWRDGTFNLADHALVIAFALITAADFLENIYYGAARLDKGLYIAMTGFLPTVGILKVVILGGTIFAISGYRKALYGKMQLTQLSFAAWSIWLTSLLVLSWLS